MPEFVAQKLDSNPHGAGPAYRITVSPPYGRGFKQRDVFRAHFGPHLPDTYVGKRAAELYCHRAGEMYLSIRYLDGENPVHQTDPMLFRPKMGSRRDENRIVLGWNDLMKYFDDLGEHDGVRVFTLKTALPEDCVPF